MSGIIAVYGDNHNYIVSTNDQTNASATWGEEGDNPMLLSLQGGVVLGVNSQ